MDTFRIKKENKALNSLIVSLGETKLEKTNRML